MTKIKQSPINPGRICTMIKYQTRDMLCLIISKCFTIRNIGTHNNNKVSLTQYEQQYLMNQEGVPEFQIISEYE